MQILPKTEIESKFCLGPIPGILEQETEFSPKKNQPPGTFPELQFHMFNSFQAENSWKLNENLIVHLNEWYLC